MAEWSRILNTTIRKYYREEEVNVLRNRKLTALLMERGRIMYNESGESMDWKVRFRRVPMVGYADMDTITFSRHDTHKTATLGWRGYAIQEAVSKKERLMNKSTEAIIKIFDNVARERMEDMQDTFGEEFYVDGNAAGNEKKIHGIESFLATGGSVTVASGYKAPSDTFAGLLTDLGNYGGTWTGSWPDGVGDASQSYDFWSPILVDYTHASAWGGASFDTWAENALVVLRAGIIKSQRSKAKSGMLDLILVDDTMYRQFLELLASKERIVVERGQKQSPLVALGYNDVINYDGVDVTWEYGIPANTGYGFNVDMMSLCSLQDQLFVPEGPDYDIGTKTWRFGGDFFGNARWNPKFFVKWKNYT